MIGVSIAAISLHMLFRKLESEKLAKFCCSEVKKILAENGVKIKSDTLRIIYDNLKESDTNSVEQVLNNGTVFSYVELEDQPDLRYSKEILNIKDLIKLRNSLKENEANNLEEEKPKISKVSAFIKFVKNLCGGEEKIMKINIEENSGKTEEKTSDNNINANEKESKLNESGANVIAEPSKNSPEKTAEKIEEEKNNIDVNNIQN